MNPARLAAPFAAALAFAVPAAALAQTPSGMDKAPTSVKPAGTPTNEAQRQGATPPGDTPKSDTIKPQSTRKSKKGLDDSSTSSGSSSSSSPSKTQPASGDVPTYPAQTKDGRPTSPGSGVTDTNTKK